MCRLMCIIAIFLTVLPAVLESQDEEYLIINPKLKGKLGALPFFGEGKIVRSDTMPPGWRENRPHKVYKMSDYIPPDAPPHGLLITGIVPDATKRYVVAITKDEEEFRRAFPEYKRLVAEGRRQAAGGILCVSRRISVSEKVEGFWGGKKTRDMPEKVGSFFYELLMIEFKNRGGCLTFLSYEPKPGDDIVDFGHGLEDIVRGVLMIEEHPAPDGGKPEYTMRIIKARVTE
jgi:hypothetical protein